VQRFRAKAIGDFLPANHEEALVGTQHGVEPVNAGQKVVIRENQKVIAALAVPTDDFVRRRIAVAVDRVSVGVALEPLVGVGRLTCCRRHDQRRGQGRHHDPNYARMLQDLRPGA